MMDLRNGFPVFELPPNTPTFGGDDAATATEPEDEIYADKNRLELEQA